MRPLLPAVLALLLFAGCDSADPPAVLPGQVTVSTDQRRYVGQTDVVVQFANASAQTLTLGSTLACVLVLEHNVGAAWVERGVPGDCAADERDVRPGAATTAELDLAGFDPGAYRVTVAFRPESGEVEPAVSEIFSLTR